MDLDAALEQLHREPDAPLDLADVALHLARDEYPDLNVEACLRQLDAWGEALRPRVRLQPLDDQVAHLCGFLFVELGFAGNTEDYYDPRNSYLNEVLERRTGIPITLSVVAMAVGQRAGMNVQGVGLPGHFITKAVEGRDFVLFDPFGGGRLLTVSACASLMRQAVGCPVTVSAAHFQPSPRHAILMRMLNNLRLIYTNQEDFQRAARVLRRLRQLQPRDCELQRDLAICLVQADEPGRAIALLNAYLDQTPADAEAARAWLARAKRDLARWN
jgi:regulator of sirC expression with transglutaminase-like and TPR domain